VFLPILWPNSCLHQYFEKNFGRVFYWEGSSQGYPVCTSSTHREKLSCSFMSMSHLYRFIWWNQPFCVYKNWIQFINYEQDKNEIKTTVWTFCFDENLAIHWKKYGWIFEQIAKKSIKIWFQCLKKANSIKCHRFFINHLKTSWYNKIKNFCKISLLKNWAFAKPSMNSTFPK